MLGTGSTHSVYFFYLNLTATLGSDEYHHHHHHHHLHPTEEETEARMTSRWDLNPDSLTPEMKCATARLYCGPQGKQEKREGRNKEQRSNTSSF